LEYEDDLASSPALDSLSAKSKARLAVTKPAPQPSLLETTGASTIAGQAAEPVAEEAIPVSVEKAIEPEETDEIEEVLNQNARRPEPEEVRPSAEPTSVPVAVSAPSGPSLLETVVPFDVNDYHLNMAALLETEKILGVMNSYPETQVELVGHSDATGKAEYNMLLSFQRAEQIASYLENKGIVRKRMLVDGKGESQPLAKETNPDGTYSALGRYLNRQVYVKVAGFVPTRTEMSGVYVPEDLRIENESSKDENVSAFLYTIQVSAARSALSLSRFDKLGKAKEYVCTDGYYRYAVGSYRTFQEATDHLKSVRKAGFEDAFIQTLVWYERAVK
jgi:outer membrane protein OmpA-like peptidoglycan-associated protein